MYSFRECPLKSLMFFLCLFCTEEVIGQPVSLQSLYEQATAMGPMEDEMRIAAHSLLIAAQERDDKQHQARAHYLLGKHHYLRMVKGESETHFRKAAELFTSLSDHENAGLAIERLGMALLQDGMPDSALLCFHQVTDIFRQHDLESRLWSPLMNISTVHQRLGNTAEAFRYAKEAVALATTIPDRATKALTLNRMMNLSRDHDSLALYTRYADAFYRLYSPLEIDEDLIRHVGQYHTISDPTARIAAINASIDHLSQWPVTLEVISSYHQLGQAYAELNRWDNALNSWKTGLERGTGEQFLHFRPILLQAIAKAYEQRGDHNNALQFFHQYVTLRDSLKDAWSKARIEELQIQYETKAKDTQIQSQQFVLGRRTQQRNAILVVLAVILVAGCYVVYAQRRYLRAQKTIAMQERKLHENQISELKKEHVLHTLQTLVTTQDEERTRIAQDLHDSLGASLATLRMQVHHEYGHSGTVGTSKTATLLNLLDNMSAEVRRISHNMMPQALIRMGLPAALEDLANTIQLSQNLDVSFQNIDYTEPLVQDKEISLYRIAQELCTNALRHSSAKHLLIQLSRHNGSATLVVEDDGKGFNAGTVEGSGIGLQNIRSRVTWLGGEMEIISGPGEGASITVQIPVT
jgi:signal transduction histidine kinase